MNHTLLTGLALAIVIAPGNAAEPSPKASPWFTDYSAARAEARQAGKPMLVVFR